MRSRLTSCLLRQRALSTSGRFGAHHAQHFHASAPQLAVKPFLLADIGEGIRECEIIQWFVEPGARVEEWDKLCEVQSDKASVEITNRYAGVIKRLHYDAGEMAKVGQPLIDIDIQSDVKEEDLEGFGEVEQSAPQPALQTAITEKPAEASPVGSGRHAGLATPAVRHLIKELDVNILEVQGTGKDGRVLKEDVHKFVEQRKSVSSMPSALPTPVPSPLSVAAAQQIETVTPLSSVQAQMFKTMTRSLAIPHFLYADEIDFSQLSRLRGRINAALAESGTDVKKVSFLPFIIKAVSLTLAQYPLLNARIEISEDDRRASVVYRSLHNIGVAMDTPQGLLVPVIKNVGHLSILDIARELSRLQGLAAEGKLSAADLGGGTITVSNIGNIGGTYVSPICVDREVAILGVGRTRTVPAFGPDGSVVPKQICNFSWSADHRVLDGATIARAGEVVRKFVEEPDTMIVHLR